MSEVLVMPGVERRDLMGEPIPSAHVLQMAVENGVTDVIVVGRQRDGSLYIACETSDADRAAGILTRAANYVASGFYGPSRQ